MDMNIKKMEKLKVEKNDLMLMLLILGFNVFSYEVEG